MITELEAEFCAADYEAELRAAGYTEAQIAKEAAYMDRVAWENAQIRSERGWNYGFHHAG